MGYCIMNIQKVKTNGALSAKYNHNFRKMDVDNAIKSLNELNETLYCEKNADGSMKTYNDSFAEHTQGLKIRKNAVLALEITTTFSRDSKVPLDEWKKENLKFFQDTFNVNPDRNNLVNVVFHGDEVGNVHCHAVVIPIDPNGRLNASYFLNGSRAISDLHDKYAERMEQFGLERGIRGSSAKHEDIRKLYGEIEQAKKLPEIKKGETAYEYRHRIREDIEKMQIAALGDRNRREYEFEQELSRRRSIFNENIKEQYKQSHERAKEQLSDYTKRMNDLQNRINDMKVIYQNLEDAAEDANDRYKKKLKEIKAIEELQEKAKAYDYFTNAIGRLDPETSQHIIDLLNARDIIIVGEGEQADEDER